MDKTACRRTTENFLGRLFAGGYAVWENIPKEEEDTCDPGTVEYGIQIDDTFTGRNYYLILEQEQRGPSDRLHGERHTFVAWFHKDIPGTWSTPPDMDTVTTKESENLYPVLLEVARDIFEHRLEYAHQAFGEDDEG